MKGQGHYNPMFETVAISCPSGLVKFKFKHKMS